MAASSRPVVSSAPQHSSSPPIGFDIVSDAGVGQNSANSPNQVEAVEEYLNKVVYRFRFLAFMGVLGYLIGSFLCFIKGLEQLHWGTTSATETFHTSSLALSSASDVDTTTPVTYACSSKDDITVCCQ
ncbi:hypothetical protein TB2_039172 [Malus domestica]